MLEEDLKPALRRKSRRMLMKNLHHDNALPHTVAAAVEVIQKLKSERVLYPGYITDLAPSDYEIF
jgi:hypothetical protein